MLPNITTVIKTNITTFIIVSLRNLNVVIFQKSTFKMISLTLQSPSLARKSSNSRDIYKNDEEDK